MSSNSDLDLEIDHLMEVDKDGLTADENLSGSIQISPSATLAEKQVKNWNVPSQPIVSPAATRQEYLDKLQLLVLKTPLPIPAQDEYRNVPEVETASQTHDEYLNVSGTNVEVIKQTKEAHPIVSFSKKLPSRPRVEVPESTLALSKLSHEGYQTGVAESIAITPGTSEIDDAGTHHLQVKIVTNTRNNILICPASRFMALLLSTGWSEIEMQEMLYRQYMIAKSKNNKLWQADATALALEQLNCPEWVNKNLGPLPCSSKNRKPKRTASPTYESRDIQCYPRDTTPKLRPAYYGPSMAEQIVSELDRLLGERQLFSVSSASPTAPAKNKSALVCSPDCPASNTQSGSTVQKRDFSDSFRDTQKGLQVSISCKPSSKHTGGKCCPLNSCAAVFKKDVAGHFIGSHFPATWWFEHQSTTPKVLRTKMVQDMVQLGKNVLSIQETLLSDLEVLTRLLNHLRKIVVQTKTELLRDLNLSSGYELTMQAIAKDLGISVPKKGFHMEQLNSVCCLFHWKVVCLVLNMSNEQGQNQFCQTEVPMWKVKVAVDRSRKEKYDKAQWLAAQIEASQISYPIETSDQLVAAAWIMSAVEAELCIPTDIKTKVPMATIGAKFATSTKPQVALKSIGSAGSQSRVSVQQRPKGPGGDSIPSKSKLDVSYQPPNSVRWGKPQILSPQKRSRESQEGPLPKQKRSTEMRGASDQLVVDANITTFREVNPKKSEGSLTITATEPIRILPQAIDTHYHLNRIRNNFHLPDISLTDVLERTQRHVIPQVHVQLYAAVNVLCDPEEYPKDQLPMDKPLAIGCHPSKYHLLNERTKQQLASLVNSPHVTAFGEIGLDRTYVKGPEEIAEQDRIFGELLDLLPKNKPLVLHVRGSEGDQMSHESHDVLNTALIKVLQATHSGQVIHLHCFTGLESDINSWLRHRPNTYFGVTGMCRSFANQELKKSVAAIPLNRLLLETDAPYFPMGRRTWTTPSVIGEVAQEVANVRAGIARMNNQYEESLDEILQATLANAKVVYRIQ